MEILMAEQHSTDVLVYFYKMYTEKLQCDVILKTPDNGQFFAHKLILAASSGYLQNLIESKQPLLQENVITVDVESKYLTTLLDFMYTGQLCVAMDTRQGLLYAASKLKMESAQCLLKRSPESVISSETESPSGKGMGTSKSSLSTLDRNLEIGKSILKSVSESRQAINYNSGLSITNIKLEQDSDPGDNLFITSVPGSGSDNETDGMFDGDDDGTDPDFTPVRHPSPRKSPRATARKRKKTPRKVVQKTPRKVVQKTQKTKGTRKPADVKETSHANAISCKIVFPSGPTKCHCGVCGTPFSAYALLKRHMIKTHQCPMLEHYLGQLIQKKYRRALYQQERYTLHVKDLQAYVRCVRCRCKFTHFSKWFFHFSQKHLSVRKYGVHRSLISYIQRRQLNPSRKLFTHLPKKDKKLKPAIPREPKGSAVTCPKCPSKLRSRLALQSHLTDQHKMTVEDAMAFVGSKKTPVTSLSSKGELSLHGSFQCSECLACVSSKQGLRLHLSRVHKLTKDKLQAFLKTKLKCDAKGCSFSSDNLILLRQHVTNSHPGLEFVCEKCGSAYPLKHMLEKHKLTTHAAKGKDLKVRCDKCGKSFAKGYHLRLHHFNKHGILHESLKIEEEGETSEEPGASPSVEMCDTCGKILKTKSGLRRHLANHNQDTVTKYQCAICSRKFNEKTHFEGHFNSHHGAKPFACKCCATFSYRASFLRHIKRCNKTGPEQKSERQTYLCSFCGSIFQRKDMLQDHMEGKHNKSLQYECGVCEAAFCWRSSWSRHKNVTGHELKRKMPSD